MSTKSKRVFSPRVDPQERLRHRFYEPLYMKWIMNPSTSVTSPIPSAGTGPVHDHRPLGQWRMFLDSLAWFGDHIHGGGSVPAIAGEDDPAGVIYWICGGLRVSADHIERVLTDLTAISTIDDEQAISQTKNEIVSYSINFSHDRVKAYRKDLADHLRMALQNSTTLGETVANDLRRLLLDPPRTEGINVCLAAYQYDGWQQLEDLMHQTSNFNRTSRWADVRHCVTRLGTWHRKSKILIEYARRNSQQLVGSSCRFLQLPSPIKLPPVDAKTDVKSALKRMLGADEQERVDQLYSQIQRHPIFNFETKFLEFYSNQDVDLPVHAEIFLLEHFYFSGARYSLMDKYVGCSKPSCYCCHLYQRYHPHNPVLRPSHGTVWPRWTPPLMANGEENDVKLRHNMTVMNNVVAYIRRDVVDEIESRLPRRERQRDSTSGATVYNDSLGS